MFEYVEPWKETFIEYPYRIVLLWGFDRPQQAQTQIQNFPKTIDRKMKCTYVYTVLYYT